MVTESATAQVYFPQAIEEQQTALDHGVFELAFYQFEWRQRTHLEQQPALRALLEELPPLFPRNRRRFAFRHQNLFNDREKPVAPAPQVLSVFCTERCE